jgi:uncharacterized protein
MRRLIKGLCMASLALSACGYAQSNDDLIPALQQLATSNNPEAIYHLGMAYQTGTGLPKDPAKALAEFRRAASLGDVLASYKLGCFYDGQGGELVEVNTETALKYKLVAANAGYALAQQDVAALYAQKGDVATALLWLERAAAQGWSDALATYASVHNGAPSVTPDAAKTAAYFQLFLNRMDPTEKQKQWLNEFRKGMSAEDRRRADEIVSAYQPNPTPLTIKALLGQRAARELVASQH